MRKSYGRARDVEVPVTTSRQKSRLALARTNITRAHMYYVYREEEYNDGGGDVGAAGCFDSAIFFPPVPSPSFTLAFRSFSLSLSLGIFCLPFYSSRPTGGMR